MADEFDWQTEVEEGWEPENPPPTKARRVISRRSKFLILVVSILILALAAVWAYTAVSSQVRDTASLAESEVLLAHELLAKAALNDDRDLADTVIARRPASWRALNNNLIAGQLFFARRPLGIEVAEATTDDSRSEVKVRLSADLDSAEITDRRAYSASVRQGITETVVLERTFYYERLDGSWWLAPLVDEREYWGNWVKDGRTNVTVTYPKRDEQFALKLSRYLDSLIKQLCGIDGIVCPEGFHLEFKLETDPTSVRRLGEGLIAVRTGSAAAADRLVLPAPTLVGMPIDEAGYEALERGYAGWIGAAIVAGLGPADELPGDVLAQFDLQPPPVPFQSLPDSSVVNLPGEVEAPNQDVLVLCSDQTSTRLLRFRTSDGHWREETTEAPWTTPDQQQADQTYSYISRYLSRLPDYRTAIIQTAVNTGSESLWQTYLWQDGSSRLVFESQGTHYALPPRLQATDQPEGGLTFLVPPQNEGSQRFKALYMDLEHCNSSPCQARELSGVPVWSPGGQHALLILAGLEAGNELQLADKDGSVLGPPIPGQSPAWLDGDQFVYIERESQVERDPLGRYFGQTAVAALLNEDGQVQQLSVFSAETVRQAIPASVRPESLALWTIRPTNSRDTWWIITARGGESGGSRDYVLLYNSQSNETRLAIPLEDFQLVEAPMLNSSGSHAVITAQSTDRSEVSVELIDVISGEVRRLANQVPSDWSADGKWLLQSYGGVLTLVSTKWDQQWTVDTGSRGCTQAIWFERQAN